MLILPRLPLLPVSAHANSRALLDIEDHYVGRSDALIFITDAVPAFGWPTGPF
jgi:hypothetical protein